MPEYVYALHDFEPENSDEVSFRASDRIEVIEKDDVYGDGWWQGRNPSGSIGLFPQTYTTAIPPAQVPNIVVDHATTDIHTSTALDPLREESEVSIHNSPNPDAPDNTRPNQNDEVMKATMTDVQKAIEQLGKNDVDGTGSFSFASTREGDWTDRELDSDQETDRDTDADGETWHTTARQKLAEKARRANERAAVDQATPMRVTVPPIQVELSDESDAEDEGYALHREPGSPLSRHPPHIIEENEDEIPASDQHNPTVDTSQEKILPGGNGLTTTNGASVTPDLSSSPVVNNGHDNRRSLPVSTSTKNTVIQASIVKEHVRQPSSSSSTRPGTVDSRDPQTPSRRSSGLPSPTATSFTSVGIEQTLTAANSSPLKSSISPQPADSMGQRSLTVSPSDWTLAEVVDWLKLKGFDQLVCDKFIEQEITGDVLLELDAELLKTEIGIPAFGKRKRIAKCIEELRSPSPAFESSLQGESILNHSRSASFVQRSTAGPWFTAPATFPSAASQPTGFLYLPESPRSGEKFDGEFSKQRHRRDSDVGSIDGNLAEPPVVTRASSRTSIVGLGINFGNKTQKTRPSHLSLSPGDQLYAKSISQDNVVAILDDDRAAVSENDTPRTANSRTSKRRHVFGRSMESTSSKDKEKDSSSRNSKEASTPVSLSSIKRESVDDTTATVRHRPRKSVDTNKTSERLSLFGSTFGGTIGKSRKPPPRYSGLADQEKEKTDKHNAFSKIYHYGERKASSRRPSTADASVKSKASAKDFKDSKELKEIKKSTDEKAEKDATTLRKRTSSMGETPHPANPPGRPRLKLGQSVMEQVGTPDHDGWMFKKSETYNNWKQRYFLLKGAHLYWLRSNSKTETRIKGYVNVVGYKIIPDENIRPGSYGFKMMHDNDKTHYFSSDSQLIIREWMKALMKTSIDRDYTKPVISSVNIPTIPLTVAQAMNPPPRPPSPTARDATQKALRRSNPNQLSTRDAQVLLMGNIPHVDTRENGGERARIESFFTNDTVPSPIETETPEASKVPPRPSRETRRDNQVQSEVDVPVDDGLIDWANSHLSPALRIQNASGSICNGLTLLRLAESIKGTPSTPPVPDSAFPSGPSDEKLDGLFRLFDFLLDNYVRMGSVSINDVRQGKRDKIIQLLKALKAWEDKKAIAQSIGNGQVPITWIL